MGNNRLLYVGEAGPQAESVKSVLEEKNYFVEIVCTAKTGLKNQQDNPLKL